MAERKRKVVPPAMLRRPIWTLRRQLLGNLVPLTVAGPLLILGLAWMYQTGKIGGPGLYLVGISVVVGWVMLNFLGLYQNSLMKRQMAWRLDEALEDLPSRRFFVGVATPNFKGWLDPHEDVGFLLFYSDRLDYFGEKLRFSFSREEVRGFEARMNVHSLIALGGWVTILAERDGKRLELKIEMRERPFLRGNRYLNRLLLKRFKNWLGSPEIVP